MGTTMGSKHFEPKHSLAKQLSFVLLGTGLILLIPLALMLVTGEMNWGPGDFVAAGVLLAGTGSAFVLLTRKLTSTRSRLGIGALLGFLFLLVWAELAVGLFD